MVFLSTVNPTHLIAAQRNGNNPASLRPPWAASKAGRAGHGSGVPRLLLFSSLHIGSCCRKGPWVSHCDASLPHWFPGCWHFLGNSARGCSLQKITVFFFSSVQFSTTAAKPVPKMKSLCYCRPSWLSPFYAPWGSAALPHAPHHCQQPQERPSFIIFAILISPTKGLSGGEMVLSPTSFPSRSALSAWREAEDHLWIISISSDAHRAQCGGVSQWNCSETNLNL